MSQVPKDGGALVKYQTLNVPLANTGTAENGTGVDRMPPGDHSGYYSCKLVLSTGAATGTPTTQTADLKLQHSTDDGATDAYADFTDEDGNGAVAQVAADNTDSTEDVNLASAKRYIRGVLTVAFTGGTSPDWPVVGLAVLTGSRKKPA